MWCWSWTDARPEPYSPAKISSDIQPIRKRSAYESRVRERCGSRCEVLFPQSNFLPLIRFEGVPQSKFVQPISFEGISSSNFLQPISFEGISSSKFVQPTSFEGISSSKFLQPISFEGISLSNFHRWLVIGKNYSKKRLHWSLVGVVVASKRSPLLLTFVRCN